MVVHQCNKKIEILKNHIKLNIFWCEQKYQNPWFKLLLVRKRYQDSTPLLTTEHKQKGIFSDRKCRKFIIFKLYFLVKIC